MGGRCWVCACLLHEFNCQLQQSGRQGCAAPVRDEAVAPIPGRAAAQLPAALDEEEGSGADLRAPPVQSAVCASARLPPHWLTSHPTDANNRMRDSRELARPKKCAGLRARAWCSASMAARYSVDISGLLPVQLRRAARPVTHDKAPLGRRGAPARRESAERACTSSASASPSRIAPALLHICAAYPCSCQGT